jgi:hypothetical protein
MSSDLWKKYNQNEFSVIDNSFLNNFRSPGVANKFVAWNPFECSSRYFKFLLFSVATKKDSDFFNMYRKIETNIGQPLNIRCSDCDINMDYLAAIEEYQFLQELAELDEVFRIIEIGGGFGRTAHTILSLCPHIVEYTIVDLKPMLELSRKYIEKVAPSFMNRIKFINSDDILSQDSLSADLVINIDSFQEMPFSVINDYMNRVVSKANKFYCKNPIGKYLPETVGFEKISPEQLLDVFNLGLCTNVIDIFDDTILAESRLRYIAAYTPPPLCTDNGLQGYRN